MGVDVLSIDGFECTLFASILGTFTSLICLSGAGHPGEEDIGGLVLVTPNTCQFSCFSDNTPPH